MVEEKPPSPPKRDWADFVDDKSRWWRLGLIILAAVIGLAALGGGAYFLYKKRQEKPPGTSTTTSVQSQPAVTKISGQTKHYSSPNFYLTLDYPNDWKLTDNGGGLMTIVSSVLELTDAAGQKIDGQITLTLRANDQPLPEFDEGNAGAAIDSVKIAYSKPTQTQRANTYMSFLTYPTSTDGIDGIYITGDYGYKKGQAIPKIDIQKVDPLISLTFAECQSSGCSKTAPAAISAEFWQNQLSEPLTKILQSLSIT